MATINTVINLIRILLGSLHTSKYTVGKRLRHDFDLILNIVVTIKFTKRIKGILSLTITEFIPRGAPDNSQSGTKLELGLSK